MAWENVGSFLGRFIKIKPPQKFFQDEVAKALKNTLNIEIDLEDIKERGGVVYFKITDPGLRNEIFLGREKILRFLEKRLGSQSPKDIRFQR